MREREIHNCEMGKKWLKNVGGKAGRPSRSRLSFTHVCVCFVTKSVTARRRRDALGTDEFARRCLIGVCLCGRKEGRTEGKKKEKKDRGKEGSGRVQISLDFKWGWKRKKDASVENVPRGKSSWELDWGWAAPQLDDEDLDSEMFSKRAASDGTIQLC